MMEQGGDRQPQAEFLRTMSICHPGWDRVGPLTLRVAGASWDAWWDRTWRPIIEPALRRARAALGTGDDAVFCALSIALEAGASERSEAAGRRLLEAHPAPPGERVWKRLRERAAAGEWTPHLFLVMTLRAQTFHLPQGELARCYLLLEAQGALLNPARAREFVQDCDRSSGEPLLRVA